jgi:PDZ domain-containing protein
VVVVLAILVIVASRIQLGYYAFSPGNAQPVGPLVHVPPGRAHRAPGKILLTDVFVSQVTLLDLLPDWLSSDTQLVPSAEVLGPYTPPSQLTDQGYVEMAQSQQAAKAAAFRRLGYTVPERDVGVLVFSVQPGSPAAPVLSVGQIITAVDGHPTPSTCPFEAALRQFAPGDTAHLTVEQSVINSTGVVESGRTTQVAVRLGRPRGASTPSGCPGVTGPPTVYLGVQIETQQDFTYPFPVSVNTAGIGGPSAGLAMTLGIIDKLSAGSLTDGRTVAATGTIDAEGDVGDVGGVAQKTVAVERAGATVFFVPPPEYKVARSAADASLHVYSVSSLDQVLAILRRLGGSVPPPPG